MPFDLPDLPHDGYGLAAWFALVVLGAFWLATQRQNKIDRTLTAIIEKLSGIESKAVENDTDIRDELREIRRDLDELRGLPKRFSHRPRR